MAEPGGEPDLLTVAEELYGLPLAEFTPARDARVKALKGTELAPRVKALRKPSAAAWVVNLLVRRETEQVDQVLSVGRALREAQQQMAGDQLRELTRQRRQLTAAVTTQARRVAREEGHRVTDAVADQVEATLTAAMVDEHCALAVRSGLLVQALATTGLDPADAAGAVALPEALGFSAPAREAPAPGRPGLRVVADPEADRKAVAAAEERLAAAEADVADAEEELRAARAAYDELEARSLQVQAELEELRSRISELESRAEQVDDELSDAEDARDEAADAAAAARSARDEAAAALERVRRR
jgi:hypothetical protein